MTMYDQDPDVLHWSPLLLDVCSIFNAGSCGSITQYGPDLSSVEYVREGYIEAEQQGYVEAEQPSVENDEFIAHAFQEELSQLTLEEASGASTSGNEQLQASVLTQDWRAPSNRYSDTEDESVLDGDVGNWLNQMVPVPHVPKINGEIPSVEDEVSDHQRLLDRLELYNFVENKVQGDGNCQFRALSDQLYHSPESHEFVRQQIVQQLKSCPQMYDGCVPMAFGDYLKKMSKSGEWGDHVTLQAAADFYGVKIFVITSFKDTCWIKILPHISKSKRVIFLSFWAEVHYNSIYPEGELPELSDYK